MRSIGMSVVLLATAAIVHAEQDAEAINLSVAWSLSVDANGHITALEPIANARADRVPQIRAELERAIHEWRFAPGTANGRAAPTQTRLSVGISVIPDGDNASRIRINSVHTGGWVSYVTPPKYPKEAIVAHHQGKVLVRLQYDENGTVTSAEMSESSAHIDPALVHAAIDIAKKWRYTPEMVDGRGVPATIVTPFCFTLHIAGSRESPAAACKLPTESKYDTLADGESVALNPAVKLETAVDGKFL
jgi:TonB family protein